MLRGRFLALVVLVALPLAASAEDPPRPAPGAEPRSVRLELRDAPLAAVLRGLCERQGRTLVLREEMPERVSLSFADMPVGDAFDQLIALHGYRKELDGEKVIVTRKVADGTTTASSDDPVGRLYLLARIPAEQAVAGIASATVGAAAVDVLPGDRELLVVARPAQHEAVRAWLESADRGQADRRFFPLFNRTISGVDSATAATRDPIARDIAGMLSPTGELAVDLTRNALIVHDDASVLERVARRIAVLDRPPLAVTIEAAALQVEPGTPLPGFAPTNDLPAAFANEGHAGVLTCFSSEPSTLDEVVIAYTDNPSELDIAEVRGRLKEKCDERKTVTLALPHVPSGIAITPRAVPGAFELEVRAGSVATRVRAASGRVVAIRGLVKTERWTGGWSPERSELVLVMVATADVTVPAPPREEPRSPREKLPELALPEEWAPASTGR